MSTRFIYAHSLICGENILLKYEIIKLFVVCVSFNEPIERTREIPSIDTECLVCQSLIRAFIFILYKQTVKNQKQKPKKKNKIKPVIGIKLLQEVKVCSFTFQSVLASY